MHERLTKGILLIKADTKLYYKKVDKENKDLGKCSRVKALSLKKLGNLDRPCLKAKGPNPAIWFASRKSFFASMLPNLAAKASCWHELARHWKSGILS